MTRGQGHNIIKNTKGKKDSQELSYPTTASLKYFNKAEEQENDPKYNLMKITEVFKEDMKKIIGRNPEKRKQVKEINKMFKT